MVEDGAGAVEAEVEGGGVEEEVEGGGVEAEVEGGGGEAEVEGGGVEEEVEGEGATVVVAGSVELGAPPPIVGEPETGDWDSEAVLVGFVEIGVVLSAVGETPPVGITEAEPGTPAEVAVFTEAEGCVKFPHDPAHERP